jgi:O-antigen ligase
VARPRAGTARGGDPVQPDPDLVAVLSTLGFELVWRRSRWVWALPALPCVLFFMAPNAVRQRVADSSQLEYYSNAERLQMLRVGWRMIRQHPLAGMGPGRVEQLYSDYLRAGETLPAYHGHLHNNVVQIAAQSGIPAVAAAMLFAICLARELWKRQRAASAPSENFLCRAARSCGLLGSRHVRLHLRSLGRPDSVVLRDTDAAHACRELVGLILNAHQEKTFGRGGRSRTHREIG